MKLWKKQANFIALLHVQYINQHWSWLKFTYETAVHMQKTHKALGRRNTE